MRRYLEPLFITVLGLCIILLLICWGSYCSPHDSHHKHYHKSPYKHDHSDIGHGIPDHNDLKITDAYARANGKNAKVGAVYFLIENGTDHDDYLTAVYYDGARKVEMHDHSIDENAVARMVEIKGDIPVPAKSIVEFRPGGKHVMLMGLERALIDGDYISLVFVFDHAGEITLSVPVNFGR